MGDPEAKSVVVEAGGRRGPGKEVEMDIVKGFEKDYEWGFRYVRGFEKYQGHRAPEEERRSPVRTDG